MQIQLSEEQMAKLRELAAAQRRSISDLIRESVDRFAATERPIDRQEIWKRALEVLGKYHSGVPDLARNHDKYLAETDEDWSG